MFSSGHSRGLIDRVRGALRCNHSAHRTEQAAIGMGAAVQALSYHTPSAREGIGTYRRIPAPSQRRSSR
ncbi:hypothetical protein [Roseiflexus castenholzii]|jgi:hypothetical protein|uniref:hypothetical protein n=1 Tax=Roseiflexus castenholzii TaxID=120962 RepID=UPI0002F5A0FD|nr:hypothetical protein [Roseiflexus castenholzii]